jgi:hypothetical protein
VSQVLLVVLDGVVTVEVDVDVLAARYVQPPLLCAAQTALSLPCARSVAAAAQVAVAPRGHRYCPQRHSMSMLVPET